MIFMVGKLVKNSTYSCIWLKTGMICMRWLPLHVIPLMDRLQWWDLTREAAIYLIQLEAPWKSWLLLQIQKSVLLKVMSFFTNSKGCSNTRSQISASVAPEGKSVVCAGEGSHVLMCMPGDMTTGPVQAEAEAEAEAGVQDVAVSPGCSCPTRMARYHFSVVTADSQTQRFGPCSEPCPRSSCTTQLTDAPRAQFAKLVQSTNTSNHPVQAASPSLPDEQPPSAQEQS